MSARARQLDEVLEGMTGPDLGLVRDELLRLRAQLARVQALPERWIGIDERDPNPFPTPWWECAQELKRALAGEAS